MPVQVATQKNFAIPNADYNYYLLLNFECSINFNYNYR